MESDLDKIAGRNRWEAAKLLNARQMNVVLMHNLTDLERKLDENLARSELSPSEVMAHIKARDILLVKDKRGGDFTSEKAKKSKGRIPTF